MGNLLLIACAAPTTIGYHEICGVFYIIYFMVIVFTQSPGIAPIRLSIAPKADEDEGSGTMLIMEIMGPAVLSKDFSYGDSIRQAIWKIPVGIFV